MRTRSTFIHLRNNTHAQRWVYVWVGSKKCKGHVAVKVRRLMEKGAPYRFRDLLAAREDRDDWSLSPYQVQSALTNLIKSGDVVKVPFVWSAQ